MVINDAARDTARIAFTIASNFRSFEIAEPAARLKAPRQHGGEAFAPSCTFPYSDVLTRVHYMPCFVAQSMKIWAICRLLVSSITMWSLPVIGPGEPLKREFGLRWGSQANLMSPPAAVIC